MRKFISVVLGVVLLVGAILVAMYFINTKFKPKPKVDKIVKTVFVDTVKNSEIPIVISTSGNVTAKYKIELFSEVQGVLRTSGKEFKAGTTYRKDEVILQINSDEFLANLKSQKSSYYSTIAAIMPDIRLDYPSEYEKWLSYLNSLDISKPTPELPQFNSNQEKLFISGREINTLYYNLKNLEVRLGKFTITAPFNGIVTEALVTSGSLVRTGQKLGEFIDTGIYELEVSVNSEYAGLLKIGNEVKLFNFEKTQQYTGKVIRVNGKVDAGTQTIKVFIELNSNTLKEGMYLEAYLNARKEPEAIEISRKLLVDNNQIFVVRDSVLELVEISPIYFSADKVVVTGIKDGTVIMSKPTSGAYNGMQVKVFKENAAQ